VDKRTRLRRGGPRLRSGQPGRPGFDRAL